MISPKLLVCFVISHLYRTTTTAWRAGCLVMSTQVLSKPNIACSGVVDRPKHLLTYVEVMADGVRWGKCL